MADTGPGAAISREGGGGRTTLFQSDSRRLNDVAVAALWERLSEVFNHVGWHRLIAQVGGLAERGLVVAGRLHFYELCRPPRRLRVCDEWTISGALRQLGLRC